MNQMEHMCRQVDADAEFIRMLEEEMGITLNPLKPQRCAPQRPLPLLCLFRVHLRTTNERLHMHIGRGVPFEEKGISTVASRRRVILHGTRCR
jgi:hypothetical protein